MSRLSRVYSQIPHVQLCPKRSRGFDPLLHQKLASTNRNFLYVRKKLDLAQNNNHNRWNISTKAKRMSPLAGSNRGPQDKRSLVRTVTVLRSSSWAKESWWAEQLTWCCLGFRTEYNPTIKCLPWCRGNVIAWAWNREDAKTYLLSRREVEFRWRI